MSYRGDAFYNGVVCDVGAWVDMHERGKRALRTRGRAASRLSINGGWPTCCFREALINADVISSGVEKPALGSAGINQTFLGIFIRHHDIGCPLVAIFDEWAPRTYTPVFLMHRLLYLAIVVETGDG
jgi:hypothetical protein